MIRITAFLFLFIMLFSCKKEEEDPAAPEIAFISISESQVTSYNNEVYVVFSYEDSQGDLGNQDPDIYSLRVKDARLSNPDEYHIPPMTPNGEELHIKGEYRVKLNTLFLLGNGNSETTKFSLQIRDRAGNWSNTIETSSVIIVP